MSSPSTSLPSDSLSPSHLPPKGCQGTVSRCVCVGVRLDKWRGGWRQESKAWVDKKPPAHYLLPISCFLIFSQSLSAVRHCVNPIRFSLTLQELMSLFLCFYSVLQNAHILGTQSRACTILIHVYRQGYFSSSTWKWINSFDYCPCTVYKQNLSKLSRSTLHSFE